MPVLNTRSGLLSTFQWNDFEALRKESSLASKCFVFGGGDEGGESISRRLAEDMKKGAGLYEVLVCMQGTMQVRISQAILLVIHP